LLLLDGDEPVGLGEAEFVREVPAADDEPPVPAAPVVVPWVVAVPAAVVDPPHPAASSTVESTMRPAGHSRRAHRRESNSDR
jgi:hypothetical protein